MLSIPNWAPKKKCEFLRIFAHQYLQGLSFCNVLFFPLQIKVTLCIDGKSDSTLWSRHTLVGAALPQAAAPVEEERFQVDGADPVGLFHGVDVQE